MSVPSMEELGRVFMAAATNDAGDRAWDDFTTESEREEIRAGLRAVLDRLKPVVAEAYEVGFLDGREDDTRAFLHYDGSQSYAAAIIDQIKGA